jgi:spoIIIJ-associated protein
MSRSVEAQGHTVEEAIQVALNQLGVSRDKVEVEIVHHPRGGFLGIGARRAKVRATLREDAFADGQQFDMSLPADRRRRGRRESTDRKPRGGERKQRGGRGEKDGDKESRGRDRDRDRDRDRNRRGREGAAEKPAEKGPDRSGERSSRPTASAEARGGQRPAPAPTGGDAVETAQGTGEDGTARRRRRRRGGRGRRKSGETSTTESPGATEGSSLMPSGGEAPAATPVAVASAVPARGADVRPDETVDRADGVAAVASSSAAWMGTSESSALDRSAVREADFESGAGAGQASMPAATQAASASSRQPVGDDDAGASACEPAEPPMDIETVRERAHVLIAELLPLLGFTGATVSSRLDEDGLEAVVEVQCDADGLLIGRRGQTLDALEHILHRMVLRGELGGDGRVLLDIGGYRERRREAIAEMATRLKARALSENRSVQLSPMSPRERRFLHQALATDGEVDMRALGSGFYRRVAISPKGLDDSRLAAADERAGDDEV